MLFGSGSAHQGGRRWPDAGGRETQGEDSRIRGARGGCHGAHLEPRPGHLGDGARGV